MMTAALKPASRITVAALAAAAVMATGVGSAAAQIPGETRVTEVFPVDDQRVQLAIDGPNLTDGTVSGSIQNNTDSPLSCKGNRDGPGRYGNAGHHCRQVCRLLCPVPLLAAGSVADRCAGSGVR